MHFKGFYLVYWKKQLCLKKNTFCIASFSYFVHSKAERKKVKLEQVPGGARIPPAGAII